MDFLLAFLKFITGYCLRNTSSCPANRQFHFPFDFNNVTKQRSIRGYARTMDKTFNVNADCKPELHYMVDISRKLNQIKAMIDKGQYFAINRARQYGKTTTLNALEHTLENDYMVINL